MEDVWSIREIITDGQDCVALLMAVFLVIAGNCECRVYYLLYLLAVPVVEEVFFFLLVELVAYVFLQGTLGAVVVNPRPEHVYS